MKKRRKVTMVCREIWRATVIVEDDDDDLESVKDKAWAQFDANKSLDLEQENYTKVETMPLSEANEDGIKEPEIDRQQ